MSTILASVRREQVNAVRVKEFSSFFAKIGGYKILNVTIKNSTFKKRAFKYINIGSKVIVQIKIEETQCENKLQIVKKGCRL